MFKIKHCYSKKDIYQLLKVPVELQRGNWDTGYQKYNDCIYVFCNIGTAGRTGHDYDNHWEGNDLVWYGKTNTHIDQPFIKDLINNTYPVYIFSREEDRSPFTYQGIATVKEYFNEIPVKIKWKMNVPNIV